MEYVKVCENCRKEFRATRSDARFCGAVCRTMANKRLKGGGNVVKMDRDPGKVVASFPSASGETLSEVLRILRVIESRMAVSDEVYLLPKKACEILSISKRTFDRYVSEGILKPYYLRGSESKTKRRIYVRRSDVLSLFQEKL